VVTGTISRSALGFLNNTATVATGIIDSAISNNVATDIDALTPQVDLQVYKSVSPNDTYAGLRVTYSITVQNQGPSDGKLSSISVADNIPPQLQVISWTCTPSGGAACTAGPSGGNIADTAVHLPYQSSILYIVTAQIYSSVTVGNSTNWAGAFAYNGVTATNQYDDLSSVDIIISRIADLSVTKTDFVSNAIPGGLVTYNITATNNGPSDASLITVTDNFPSSDLYNVKWNCYSYAGANCNAGPGTGDITATNVKLPNGGTVVFTVTANIYSNATGLLINNVTLATTDVTDSVPSNDASGDADTLIPTASVSVSKSDGVSVVIAGQTTNITYTINVRNLGPSDAPSGSVSVVDTFDSNFISSVSWTCSPSTYCVTGPFTSQPLKDTTFSLPAGQTVTYTV